MTDAQSLRNPGRYRKPRRGGNSFFSYKSLKGRSFSRNSYSGGQPDKEEREEMVLPILPSPTATTLIDYYNRDLPPLPASLSSTLPGRFS